MRIFKFVCWLRGYHTAVYTITSYNAPDIFGHTNAPCWTCKTPVKNGPVPGSWITVQWPYGQKRNPWDSF